MAASELLLHLRKELRESEGAKLGEYDGCWKSLGGLSEMNVVLDNKESCFFSPIAVS